MARGDVSRDSVRVGDRLWTPLLFQDDETLFEVEVDALDSETPLIHYRTVGDGPERSGWKNDWQFERTPSRAGG